MGGKVRPPKQYKYTGDEIRAMTTSEIEDLVNEISATITPMQRAFVEARLQGKPTSDAMRAAGYSNPGNAFNYFTKRGQNVRTILELFRERANREVIGTAVEVRKKYWDVYHKAFANGEYGTAKNTLDSLVKLDGLAAAEQVKLIVDKAPDREVITDVEWRMLSEAVHELEPKLGIENHPSTVVEQSDESGTKQRTVN